MAWRGEVAAAQLEKAIAAIAEGGSSGAGDAAPGRLAARRAGRREGDVRRHRSPAPAKPPTTSPFPARGARLALWHVSNGAP